MNMLEELVKLPQIVRMQYGSGTDRPNEHCHWNPDRELWMENDEHFAARIKTVVGAAK